MTYTFKLSRRLAASRHWGVLLSLPLFAACATGDSDGFGPSEPGEIVDIVIIPRTAVVEVNQPLQYRAYGLTIDGDRVPVDMDWSATGGTISPDGVFLASTTGTGRVLGNGHGKGKAKGHAKRDSTPIDVVPPPPPDMEAVIVSPASIDLNTSGTRQFAALGRLSDGSTVPVGVEWSATGGNIDPGGFYTAGQAIGHYQATAIHPGTQLSGSAAVAISLPPPSAPPELPRVFLTTDYPTLTGQTITVPSGGDLQAALNSAQPGDEIVLAAGVTYTGAFSLPAKTGSGWIVIRTSDLTGLPPAGSRVQPADRVHMARIEHTDGNGAFVTADRAHHYRLVGLEMTPGPSVSYAYKVVDFGGTAGNIPADMPHHLILDRSYVHGRANLNTRHCVALNGGAAAVIDSYISECHDTGFDAHAIASWRGTGPYKIVNNYLEGAAENVILGGSGGSPAWDVNADVEIRHNYFFKPLSWNPRHPSYAGRPWLVKNLFEIKDGQRILVEGNIFENNWRGAHIGHVMLFQVIDGTHARIADVTVRYNIARYAPGGITCCGRYDYDGTRGMPPRIERVAFEHNLFYDLGIDPAILGTGGRDVLVQGDPNAVTFSHNTILGTFSAMTIDNHGPVTNGAILDNIFHRGCCGIRGGGVEGMAGLNTWMPGAPITGNIIAGDASVAGRYPAGNFFPASEAAIGFVGNRDFTLAASSPYQGTATDGTDPGPDMAALLAKTNGARTGQ